MPHLDAVKENFRFLLIEVVKQTENTVSVLKDRDNRLIGQIQARDDYIDILKSIIANKTFKILLEAEKMSKPTADMIKAINVITNNLENIADFCTNIVGQTMYLSDVAFLEPFECNRFTRIILKALNRIEWSLFLRDVDVALKICRSEFHLDGLYKAKFDIIMERLRAEKDLVSDLISSLFILRYFERMGDCLLNIGEAVISAAIGEKLKIHQYMALEENFDALALKGGKARLATDSPRDFAFEPIGETKSGNQIGRVREKKWKKSQWVIFKEGNEEKLVQEKNSIEIWNHLMPGLPPKIFGLQQIDGNASILVEFLEGVTFQNLLIEQDIERIHEALHHIQLILESVWEKTKKKNPCRGRYIKQLLDRTEDVFRLHPDFNSPDLKIGSLRVPSFMERLSRVAEIESTLEAPFSVFIHGDFNTDNMIYNFHTKCVHFIDLHRSCDMDYIQDISVFLVSIFRLPVFGDRIRDRLSKISIAFYRFARDYAHRNGDTVFDARLAMGLIRSFITSTRFMLNGKFARTLFLRASYLMDRVTEPHASSDSGQNGGRSLESFELPVDVLVY